MAKIKVVGEAVIVTSAVKAAELKKLAKYKPNALVMIDPETKNETFRVAFGTQAGFTPFGATFTSEDAQGNAQMTLSLNTGITNADKAATVKDKYGYALLKLNTIENFIDAAVEAVADDFADMEAAITVE